VVNPIAVTALLSLYIAANKEYNYNEDILFSNMQIQLLLSYVVRNFHLSSSYF